MSKVSINLVLEVEPKENYDDGNLGSVVSLVENAISFDRPLGQELEIHSVVVADARRMTVKGCEAAQDPHELETKEWVAWTWANRCPCKRCVAAGG